MPAAVSVTGGGVSFCPFAVGARLAHSAGVGITPAQFDQMKQRTAGLRRPLAVPAPVAAAAAETRKSAVILGIDPSLRGTGYGLVRPLRAGPRLITAGTIKCPASWERSRCLVKISQTLRDLVRAHAPTCCVIEGLFYAQNLQTALLMGEARGAALAAVAESGLEIYEIAARKVKQAIVGYGAAQKLAVARMVQRLLNLDTVPEPDAADALALALAHAQGQAGYPLKSLKRL